MAKYLLTCWNEECIIDADLSEASAPILVDGAGTPYQTADCQHRRDTLRTLIAAWCYRETSDCDADFDSIACLEDLDDDEAIAEAEQRIETLHGYRPR
jgi:hypothetical protein